MLPLILGFMVQAAPPAPVVTAFTNVHVLTMDDARLLRQQTVVVTGETISAVGPAARVRVPPGARIVDGGGRMVLLPGLTDAHVHLEADPASWMPLFLASGVTTVFNMRGDSATVALRDAVRRGSLPGPTIHTAGFYTNLPAIRTPADAARAVDEHRARGFDFIKIHGNLDDSTYTALAAASRRAGVPLLGHAPRNLPFGAVIAQRQSLVAHLEELLYTRFSRLDTVGLGALAREMAAADVWLVPTLTTFAGIAAQWGRPDAVTAALALPATAPLPTTLRDYWTRQNPYTGRTEGAEWAARALATQRSMLRALHAAGVHLLTGTDTPLPIMMPGSSLHDELAELVAAGLPPLAALRAATSEPGRWASRLAGAEPFGRVAVGQRADLLLVESNPLDSLGRLRRPAGVMARGRWYARDSLERMVAAVPAAAARRAAAATEVVVDSAVLRRYVGRYATAEGRAAVVTLTEGRLQLTVPGQAPFLLGATSDSTFRLVNSVTGLSAVFGEQGVVLSILQGGRVVILARRE